MFASRDKKNPIKNPAVHPQLPGWSRRAARPCYPRRRLGRATQADHPHCVRTRQRGEVSRGEALAGEGGDETVEGGVRAQEVGGVRGRRVAAAKRNRPARPAELRSVAACTV
jgi:hypothetical protein